MWRSPNGTIPISRRHDFREPISARTFRVSSHWNLPIVVARHGFGTSIAPPRSSLTARNDQALVQPTAAGNGRARGLQGPGRGRQLAMFIWTSLSAASRAPVSTTACNASTRYISPPRPPFSIVYDGRFKNYVQEIFEKEFKSKFDRSETDLRAPLDRRHGSRKPQVERRLPVACKNYDGDVQSDTVAKATAHSAS